MTMVRLKKHFLIIIFLVVLLVTFYCSQKLSDSKKKSKNSSSVQQPVVSSIDLDSDDDIINGSSSSSSSLVRENNKAFLPAPAIATPLSSPSSSATKEIFSTCSPLEYQTADITTSKIYAKLNFNADWIDRREYWNVKFEKRYRERRKIWSKLPLKVIVVPHSHNDPGWLKTFETYFATATNNILNNAVDKMVKYRNLTFVWTEMAFLHMWWETAHPVRRENLKSLIQEGRFEIPTGGWVMTDEANVHVFAMVDQLIEGHQWARNVLEVTPKQSWSVDPFGHGATFPYLLKEAGLDGMFIMRIHYAWKEYFAKHQNGDFMWQQPWDKTGEHSILCHNFPYDIYSVKGSCGPSAQICLEFNFRKVAGEYNEYTARYTPIHPGNVQERAELLLEQYGKTGSLLPHNVVLVPLGDDFAYIHEIEWDQQYTNYKMLMDYINSRKDDYHAEVRFGVLSDYFEEVRRRMKEFPTLNGDFYVYSDVFSEGRPTYWSGYYTTRPFMKQLSRELENNLRSAEILFTIAYNFGRQSGKEGAVDRFTLLFPDLVAARRNLGLFQHHDAITGTSKQYVMHDYGVKLHEGITRSRNIQRESIQYLMHKNPDIYANKLLSDDYTRQEYSDDPLPIPLNLKYSNETIIVFNSLTTPKEEIVSFFTEAEDFCILDPSSGKYLPFQVNPTWNSTGFFRLDVHFVEVIFFAELPPLTVKKFVVVGKCKGQSFEKTELYCLRCPSDSKNKYTSMSPMKDGAVKIENAQYSLMIDGTSRMLRSITHKPSGKTAKVSILLAAYPTAQFRSGAYTFKPDDHQPENIEVLDVDKNLKEIVIISGPIFSEISIIFEAPMTTGQQKELSDQIPGSFAHTIRLYHSNGSGDDELSKGIYIENNFDLGGSMNNRDIDLFMRFRSDIENGRTPIFYTDSNGFQMTKRIKVEDIGIEGNYFPITSMTYIEDDSARLTLVVDHAQGAASWQQGWLEVMVDRRSSYDDAKGMGEGVLDSRSTSHKYWLLYEPKTEDDSQFPLVSLPSMTSIFFSRRLNYPSIQFISPTKGGETFFKDSLSLIMTSALPCDTHLFNLRTLTKPDVPSQDYPSESVLLILQKQSGDCVLNPVKNCFKTVDNSFFNPELVKIQSVIPTSLTGLHDQSEKKSKNLKKILEQLKPMTLTTVKVTF